MLGPAWFKMKYNPISQAKLLCYPGTCQSNQLSTKSQLDDPKLVDPPFARIEAYF